MDNLFKERDELAGAILEGVRSSAEEWGMECSRYQIRDLRLPEGVARAMQLQVEAERRRRAAVLEAEGIKEAEISVAEGKKQVK